MYHCPGYASQGCGVNLQGPHMRTGCYGKHTIRCSRFHTSLQMVDLNRVRNEEEASRTCRFCCTEVLRRADLQREAEASPLIVDLLKQIDEPRAARREEGFARTLRLYTVDSNARTEAEKGKRIFGFEYWMSPGVGKFLTSRRDIDLLKGYDELLKSSPVPRPVRPVWTLEAARKRKRELDKAAARRALGGSSTKNRAAQAFRSSQEKKAEEVRKAKKAKKKS